MCQSSVYEVSSIYIWNFVSKYLAKINIIWVNSSEVSCINVCFHRWVGPGTSIVELKEKRHTTICLLICRLSLEIKQCTTTLAPSLENFFGHRLDKQCYKTVNSYGNWEMPGALPGLEHGCSVPFTQLLPIYVLPDNVPIRKTPAPIQSMAKNTYTWWFLWQNGG